MEWWTRDYPDFRALPERAGVVRLKDRSRSRISRDGLALEEAATYLGLNHATVAEAIRRRLLVAIDCSKTGTGFRRVAVKALESFKGRLVGGSTLAAGLHCHPCRVAAAMRKRGIRPALAPGAKAGVIAVYRKSVLPPELLDAVSGTVEDPSGESLAVAINAAGTSFQCPSSLKDGKASLCNNARTVRVLVRVGDGGVMMSTECDPVASPKRMERLENRIGLLTDHPTIRVVRFGGGALVSRLGEFDRADRSTWGKAALWALTHLATVTEVFSREALGKS